MATQGTNEGGSNTNRERRTVNGVKSQGGYAGKTARYPRKENSQSIQSRYGKSEGVKNGARYGRAESGYSAKPYDKSKSYSSAPKFSGKDEDDEDSGRRSKPSRPKESKPGVAIPDKNKVQLRLEKEQKSMKRKQQNKKRESNRPQPRVKRANNVNYTRNYANGDYDDYEE